MIYRFLALGLLGLASCSSQMGDIPKTPELEVRADGLSYLKGATTPFSGEFVKLARNGIKQEIATYRNGKLDGPTLFYVKESQLKRRTDFADGNRVRKRVWYDNGQLKADEGWDGSEVLGKSSYWFPDGRLRKEIRWARGMKVDGHVIEFAENGEVIFDLIMDMGKFVSGKWKPGSEDLLGQRYSADDPGDTRKSAAPPPVSAKL